MWVKVRSFLFQAIMPAIKILAWSSVGWGSVSGLQNFNPVSLNNKPPWGWVITDPFAAAKISFFIVVRIKS